MKRNERIRKNRQIILLYVLGIIIMLFNLYIIANHEAWRDEAQSWLVARDSSIINLFNLTSVEGHPFLYFVILMPFAKLGFPYVTSNILSWLIMMVAILLFIGKVKVNLWVKFIVIFSPMFVFYYSVFARSYALIGLIIVCIMVVYPDRYDKPITYGILLALLTQVHVIMLGFVMILSLFWLIDIVNSLVQEKDFRDNRKRIEGLSIVLFSGVFLLWEFRKVFNTTALDEQDIKSGQSENAEIIGLLVLFTFVSVCIIYKIVKNRKCFEAIIILICSHVWELIVLLIYQGHIWQIITWLYVLTFVSCSLLHNEEEREERGVIITLISLIVLSIPAILSSYNIKPIVWDCSGIYSGSKATSEFIEEKIDDDAVIIFNDEDYCLSIIPYLKKRELFNIFTGRRASYIDRNKNIRHRLTKKEYDCLIEELLMERNEIYLVYSIKSNMIEGLDEKISSYELIYDESSIDIITEKYKIYKIVGNV